MISLFIDTSLEYVRAAIIKDGIILSSKEENNPNMHSVYATKYVKDVLDDANIEAKDVDKIMVVNGPGSFTGVRIGVTIAKTYGYLIDKYITPVSSLKSMAISNKHDNYTMSLISARRGNYYMGLYDKDNNEVVSEQFTNTEYILELINKYNPVIVSNQVGIVGNYKIEKSNFNILDIVNYYIDKDDINYHALVPNYLKLPQVLEDDKRD